MPGFQSFTVSQSLLTFMFIELVMLSDHLILYHPLLLLPSIFPSIRDFSIEPALRIKWPKYLSFSFSISPSNEYSGFISFRTQWFDLLAIQGTLKSLLQYLNSKASIFPLSVFFIVQLSHPYMTPGKPIALTSMYISNNYCSLIENFYYCIYTLIIKYRLPWCFTGRESACQCRRCRFNPWVRNITWRRKCQPAPVFLPGKPHGQRSLAGFAPWGCKELDMT